jgi:hypothetical protein
MTRRFARIAVLGLAFVVALLLASGLAGAQDPRDAKTFEFGLWGDMPYARSGDGPKIPALIRHINQADLAFTVYDGDTKDGSSECTNDLIFAQAWNRFNELKAPAVYVPGDNEWTDCHRTNNGGYDNLERLTFLRANMFNTVESLGQRKMPLEHQGPLGHAYSENTRWTYGDVVFAGLNVPGSNNNKVTPSDCFTASARTQGKCDADNEEYAERDAKNIEWLHSTFEMARQRRAIGVVVVIQADMWFDLPETPVDERKQPGVDGYDKFIASLVGETQAYTGQVVLVHGDTHFFKIDKPLLDQARMIPNLTRVETFGSPNVHWIKVTVEPKSPAVFRFEPMIVPGN